MRPDSHTTRAYFFVDKSVRALERFLKISIKSAHGYSATAISRRIAQAVAMQMVDPFLKKTINEGGKSYFIEGLPQKMSCGELEINTKTGMIAPTKKFLFLNIVKFLILWLFVWGYFIRSILNKRSDFGQATLFFGVPDSNLRAEGSARRFEDFCHNGPLDVLSKAKKCIVQVIQSVVAVNPKKFIYVRFPLLNLFSANRLGIKQNINFIKEHISIFYHFIKLIFRNPIACLLWRDFAEHSVASAMNNKKLIEAIIITNTNWLQQFLWMSDLSNRHFKTYMALYSLNSSSLKFKDDPAPAPHPGIRHLRVDLILIWDTFYKEVLKQENIFCKTQVVAPILWCLPKDNLAIQNSEFLRICVFDVSPMTREALFSRGMLGNYYNAQTMKAFLSDVLTIIDDAKKYLGRKVKITLKHKRIRSGAHDDLYFSYVAELCASKDYFRLADEDTNLFALIAQSDLVIVIPYSSPGYVANYLKIPTIFYDPTNEILPTNEVPFPIKFAAGKADLLNAIKQIFAQQAS